jgi:hypothetical protein
MPSKFEVDFTQEKRKGMNFECGQCQNLKQFLLNVSLLQCLSPVRLAKLADEEEEDYDTHTSAYRKRFRKFPTCSDWQDYIVQSR